VREPAWRTWVVVGPAPAADGLLERRGGGGGGGPPGGGGGPPPHGRWSTEPPTSSAQSPPEEGGSCQPTDVGRVLRDSAGRPVSCLRDPNGLLSWSDVS
ncbi:hypothetical protein ND748_32700, partial [Frankia sp. AiPs1]|nr:hypothetical protein [Frankia sp. AiPs1]